MSRYNDALIVGHMNINIVTLTIELTIKTK